MEKEKLVFEKFIRAIDQYAMVSEGDKILIALSGGADSVALFLLFMDFQSKMKLNICAAHLNHGLRGKESDEDERFVKELCQKFSAKCFSTRENIKERAKRDRTSIEVAGREARLGFLQKISGKIKANKIALGHTMNDQAENLLLRLFRGSGTKGLSSMKPSDGNIIRPLLSISRREIESYLRFKKSSYRIDSSNEDMRFTRNRIRHNLIPFLKEEYNPEIVETLARTAQILSEEDSFLDSLISEIIRREAKIKNGSVEISLELLKHLAPALSRRIIRRSIQFIRGNLRKITFKDIEKAREIMVKSKGNRNLLLPSGINVKIYKDSITLAASSDSDPIYKDTQQVLNIEGLTEISHHAVLVEAKVMKREDFKDDLKAGSSEKAFLDFEKTGAKLSIRTIKKGDFFHPFNSPGRKKVSDYFIDKKVPQEKRKETLIVTSKDHIVWIAGYQIDDRFKIDRDTKKVLILKLIREIPETEGSDLYQQ